VHVLPCVSFFLSSSLRGLGIAQDLTGSLLCKFTTWNKITIRILELNEDNKLCFSSKAGVLICIAGEDSPHKYRNKV
jgi:hypothetical protein